MAYDEKLAARIRELADGVPSLTEKKMFGGVAFLVGGNMAVSASGQGGLLVRVDPDDSAMLTAEPGVEVAVMRGRAMPGWLRVAADRVTTHSALKSWVDRAVRYAATLPPK
jgi:TfoX/Sxy family transcriptional regulator of competence genes